eukprot:CAMPEP_0184485100 /NCGR_PEP_ID=MMETSP0113_2-20130426/6741_1 /TAXON_ID=91329 /ORGANISM="Norrisiella sphaerica, Strain BC52" /LENGTH=104 /DNA_ID=CAMNT_0026866389 /DNA_START=66 /DNA_END=380 /DNA_ORIENTATION=-
MSFLKRAFNVVKESYLKRLRMDLNKYGLRYDDLLIETDPDVVTAISRLSPRERALRTMRLKRALDCELKHSYVPEQYWDKQGPHRYLTPMIEQARKERLEKDYL